VPHAAIVLAAGRGERFGGGKLSALLRGVPLIGHALAAACAAPVARIVVVARDDVPVLADDPRITVIRMASPALSASLSAGLAAAGDVDGAFVFLADMPLVPHDMAARLLAAQGDAIAALPTWQGQPGHPVLLSRRGFALAEGLTGDEGLGRMLRGRADVLCLPVAEPGVTQDADTPDALAALDFPASFVS
jgi:molybdenum cofactor cytidylyltransferase